MHHWNKASIDDVADECYPCVHAEKTLGFYPNWQPISFSNCPADGFFADDYDDVEIEEEMGWQGKFDNVNSPNHYCIKPGLEVIDVRDALLEKMEGVLTLKQSDSWSRSWEYLTRAFLKNGVEDLKKAEFYLKKLIKETNAPK